MRRTSSGITMPTLIREICNPKMSHMSRRIMRRTIPLTQISKTLLHLQKTNKNRKRINHINLPLKNILQILNKQNENTLTKPKHSTSTMCFDKNSF